MVRVASDIEAAQHARRVGHMVAQGQFCCVVVLGVGVLAVARHLRRPGVNGALAAGRAVSRLPVRDRLGAPRQRLFGIVVADTLAEVEERVLEIVLVLVRNLTAVSGAVGLDAAVAKVCKVGAGGGKVGLGGCGTDIDVDDGCRCR